MKKWLCLNLLLFNAIFLNAQIITTFAGNGSLLNSGDGGQATSAGIDYPAGCVFGKDGSFYLSTGLNGKTIRRINSSGVITKVAGTGLGGYSGDGGPATSAKFSNPQMLAQDTLGNIYFSDAQENVIRKIDVLTGIISTVAGTGVASYGGDGGPATSAQLDNPNGICFDKWNNLYIADYGNARVRKVNTMGIISTFAGTGINGYNGDGGKADTSMLRGVLDVCTDTTGNVYIADEANFRIRKVDLLGFIYTIAGNGGSAYSGDGGPATSAQITPHIIDCDKLGRIFATDIYVDRIRMIDPYGVIYTIVGTTSGFSGDGGPATAAQLNNVGDVTIDTCGNIYIGDVTNHRFRKITFYPSCGYPSLGIDKNFIQEVSIFPNPVNDVLYIENAQLNGDYKLCNMFGAVMQQGMLPNSNNTIPLGLLPPGMYFTANCR